MPTVSIIMPAFNVEPYVGESIRSALTQTYSDFEIIVVDDGSKDGTADVVRSLAETDRRIRLIQQANRGLAGARNTALRAARGEFLALLDSDDLWEREFLQAQMTILASRPEVDIVSGNGWFLGGAQNGQVARPSPDSRPDPDLPQIIGDERAIFIMCVFRRRVYEAIGPFDESMRTNEDYDFWLRASLAGFRFARNDRPLGHYRVRSDSLSASEIRMLRGILYVYTKFRPAISHRPYEQAVLARQIKRFETEWMAAEARLALEMADFEAASEHLSALQERRGGPTIALARLLAKWAPRLLARVYERRRPKAPTVPAGTPLT